MQLSNNKSYLTPNILYLKDDFGDGTVKDEYETETNTKERNAIIIGKSSCPEYIN